MVEVIGRPLFQLSFSPRAGLYDMWCYSVSVQGSGSFHSKERFEQVKALPRFALRLSHIVKAMVPI